MQPRIPPIIDQAGALTINMIRQEARVGKMAAQGNQEVDELTPRGRAKLRLLGFVLIAVGFITFLTAPILWILLVPDGNPIMAAAFFIIAMAILMGGGLMIGLGSMKRIGPRDDTRGIQLPRNRTEMLQAAQNLEAAERLEEAAEIYEQLGMFQEAGDLRRRAKAQVITHVNVDVDQLIEELRKGGLTTSFNCPNCGAVAKITGSTPSSALARCSFCGAAFKTTDIMDVLAKVTNR